MYFGKMQVIYIVYLFGRKTQQKHKTKQLITFKGKIQAVVKCLMAAFLMIKNVGSVMNLGENNLKPNNWIINQVVHIWKISDKLKTLSYLPGQAWKDE